VEEAASSPLVVLEAPFEFFPDWVVLVEQEPSVDAELLVWPVSEEVRLPPLPELRREEVVVELVAAPLLLSREEVDLDLDPLDFVVPRLPLLPTVTVVVTVKPPVEFWPLFAC
jgi:hypothetical protein